MQLSTQLARNLREVHFGVNWTWVNMKDNLKDVDWQQATTKVDSFNTIATLVYHTHYFIAVTTKVLEGGPLDGHDKYSFDHPPIQSQQDWEQFLDTVWACANGFADLVEQLPDAKLWETFVEEKYGTYYRNIQGIIEHTHYHLGQITLLKKLLREG